MDLPAWLSGELWALAQVLIIDVVLAGDNAVVIGMAAAKVPLAHRRKVIFWGLAAAVALRIAMAAVTTTLMSIVGLMLAGGILLLWVSWRLYRDIALQKEEDAGAAVTADTEAPAVDTPVKDADRAIVKKAILQIFLADVSMSLDNVLAVAGAARDHIEVLVIGLLMSIVLMGVAAGFVAKLLQKYHWISYVGLIIVVYVALSMMWHGYEDIAKAMG